MNSEVHADYCLVK